MPGTLAPDVDPRGKHDMKDNKIANSIITRLLGLFITILLLFFGVSGGVYAAAETGDNSGIMKELSGLKLDGKPFSAEDYPADKSGLPKILLLNEAGYSYYYNRNAAYALTLYIYNPAQIAVKDDVRNTVQMRVGSAQRFSKYALTLDSMSADKLFCKFKLNLKESEKQILLDQLDSEERIYEISSIELYVSGSNATDYAIDPTNIYTYTGYAEGFGQTSGEGTLSGKLSYTIKGGKDVIPLSVEHTSWRPEGTNGKSEYTQDVIHSVYFAVPNDLAGQYDYLNSVHARWIEARTAMSYITGNMDIYDDILNVMLDNVQRSVLMQQDLPDKFDIPDKLGWYLISSERRQNEYEYAYGCRKDIFNALQVFLVKNVIGSIYLAKYLDGAGVVTSDEVQKMVEDTVAILTRMGVNDKKVAGKYPSALFESYDTEFTDEIIEVGREYTLNSEQVERNFWEKLIGGSHIENKQDYKVMKAIYEVSDSDFAGNVNEICNKLYISERDYEKFSLFYSANKKTSTVYLLRFATSEYFRAEMDEYTWDWGEIYSKKSAGYLAQSNCYFDFDIIDLEYVKDDQSVIIPVSMSPVDIYTELTPPPSATISDFWKYGAAVIGGLIAFYMVYKFAANIYEKSARGL